MSYLYGATFTVPSVYFSDPGGMTTEQDLDLTALTPFLPTGAIEGGGAYTGGLPASAAEFLAAASAVSASDLLVEDNGSGIVNAILLNCSTAYGSIWSITSGKLTVSYDTLANALTTDAGTLTIKYRTSTMIPAAPSSGTVGRSNAKSTTIRYKKVVCWGLSPSAINFARRAPWVTEYPLSSLWT